MVSTALIPGSSLKMEVAHVKWTHSTERSFSNLLFSLLFQIISPINEQKLLSFGYSFPSILSTHYSIYPLVVQNQYIVLDQTAHLRSSKQAVRYMGLEINTWVPKGLSKSTDEIKHTYLLLMDYCMQWNGLT